MSRGSYDDFIEALGQRESSGNYQAENQFHYLGKYQMGELSFLDIGLVNKDTTNANDYAGGFKANTVFIARLNFLLHQPHKTKRSEIIW
jgi:hypothetical protein